MTWYFVGKRRIVAPALMLAGLLALIMAFPKTPRLIWNATSSAPIGLYYVSARPAAPGTLAVADLPAAIARFADERRYLPLGVPLIKPVAAIAGDTVCSRGRVISINGRDIANRLDHDLSGRPLPHWRGCRRLGPNSVFLLNRDVPASFDGRYFGLIPKASILGTARPIWTR